ncbi:hypothetical protein D3C78_1429720 [compost metagenome]
MRRDIRVFDLVFRAGNDPHPRLAVLLDRREQDHVVDADQVGLDLVQHRRQILLRPLGGFDDGRPAFLDVVVDLLQRRLAEVRNVAVDEIHPVAGHLFGRHRRRHVDHVLFKTITGVDTAHARVGEEHRFMAQGFTGLGDTH